MTKTIRWGIIGAGDVTEVKSGPALQNADNSALVAVMRRNPDKASDYALRHGVPKWYGDATALIADPEIDAIYVATPPYAHKEYAVAAAAAGKPVYVEKPMALNHAECQEMIHACQQAGVALWVAYYRRSLPRFVRVKQLLDTGAIGQARFVDVRLTQRPRLTFRAHEQLPWRVRPELSGGGLFVDLASHTLDFLDYAFGPITDVKGHASNQGGLYAAEDMVTASFVHTSGVLGAGVWCFNAYENADFVDIVGSDGKITFSTFGTEPIKLHRGDDITEYPEPTPPHIQQPLIQSIVDELNGDGRCPSSGESGARTTWVMDQILSSYYDGA